VCRVVAEGKNPIAYTAESCMSQPVVTVSPNDPLEESSRRWKDIRSAVCQSQTNTDAAPASSHKRIPPELSLYQQWANWFAKSRKTPAGASRAKSQAQDGLSLNRLVDAPLTSLALKGTR
jgi:hypothetical protein